MPLRIAILSFVVGSLLACSKDYIPKPYSFLSLIVEGQDEDIRWETIKSKWDDSLGNITMDANSYYFDKFKLDLRKISDTGVILNLSISNLFYTDGLNFIPFLIEYGYVRVTEKGVKSIRGIFEVRFHSSFNGYSSKVIKGNFVVVN